MQVGHEPTIPDQLPLNELPSSICIKELLEQARIDSSLIYRSGSHRPHGRDKVELMRGSQPLTAAGQLRPIPYPWYAEM